MELSDMNEILAMACVSIESGFERVMIDPQDVVSIIDQHHEIFAALEAVVSVADRATIEFDMARAAIAKARGKV